MLAIAIGADGSSLLLYSSYENGMGRKETDKAGRGRRRRGSEALHGGGRAQT